MEKIVVYESWNKNKTDKKFTKDDIKTLYNLDNPKFGYYCDYVSSRRSFENRPNLQNIIKAMENGEIDTMYIKSINHISRNIQDICAFLKIAKLYDCKVIDKTSGVDYTKEYYKYIMLMEMSKFEKERNMIEVETNNGSILRVCQTDADKARVGVGLERIDDYGYIYRRDLIDEADFVMLMNYYCYIKDNDIKDEFINPNGKNEKDNVEDYIDM